LTLIKNSLPLRARRLTARGRAQLTLIEIVSRLIPACVK
jgi:hypothetical protein